MLDSENELIKNAIEGESSAFGLLYDYYQPRIYRFIFFKVGQKEEAEDLTHEVFLSAWQNIRSYKNRGFPFSSWLYQIARNRIIDYYRTRKSDIGLEEIDPEKFSVPPSVYSTTEEKLELEKLINSIRKLKPEYQDVIIMRFIEDMPIKEVAAFFKKSEGAVKILQHRAIAELKKLIEKK